MAKVGEGRDKKKPIRIGQDPSRRRPCPERIGTHITNADKPAIALISARAALPATAARFPKWLLLDTMQCPALTALPSSQQSADTDTVKVPRRAALAPIDASQKMARSRSSDRMAQ